MNSLNTSEDAWEISRSAIAVGDKLGQGNYGAVFKGQLTVTAMSPKIYAHKQEMEFEGKSHFNVAVKMLRCKCIYIIVPVSDRGHAGVAFMYCIIGGLPVIWGVTIHIFFPFRWQP